MDNNRSFAVADETTSCVTVRYTFKRNQRVISQELHPWYRLMLQMCANDLTVEGFQKTVQVVFQGGISRDQAACYGMCDFFRRSVPTIYIYTYRLRVSRIVDTIAHEFGHVSHFLSLPVSRQWPSEKQEQYANLYQKLMRENFDARMKQ